MSASSLPWEQIDAFEGDEYERLQVSVELADGSAVDAYVYVLAPA